MNSTKNLALKGAPGEPFGSATGGVGTKQVFAYNLPGAYRPQLWLLIVSIFPSGKSGVTGTPQAAFIAREK